ncbi:MAG: hypothetical protein ACRBBN_02090 [Methyloligellaceae bacterium]
MSKHHTIDQDFELSSWATPTEEDIIRFKSLTPEQQRAVFTRQLDQASKSGVSNRKPSDILKDVLSRNSK